MQATFYRTSISLSAAGNFVRTYLSDMKEKKVVSQEKQIVEMLANGASTKHISERNKITVGQCRSKIEQIKKKHGAKNIYSLITMMLDKRILSPDTTINDNTDQYVSELTQEEIVIASLSFRGLSSRQIKEKMGSTTRAVECKISRMLKKIQAKNKAHALYMLLSNERIRGEINKVNNL